MSYGVSMAKLSILIEPRKDDWQIAMEADPDRWGPEILRGSVLLSMEGVPLASVSRAAPHLVNGRIPQVVIGMFLEQLLEIGLQVLSRDRGTREIQVDATNFLLRFKSTADSVEVEVALPSGRFVRRLDVLLAGSLTKKEFAATLLESARPLLERSSCEFSGSSEDSC